MTDSPGLRACSAACLAIALALGSLGPAAIAQPTIEPAPAFNAERLSTLPRDEWITNGGTLANQRYSANTDPRAGNPFDRQPRAGAEWRRASRR